VRPFVGPHVSEVHLLVAGVHDEASWRCEAGDQDSHIGEAVAVKTDMANFCKTVIGPIKFPCNRVDGQSLWLPDGIRIFDEQFVLLVCAPLLP